MVDTLALGCLLPFLVGAAALLCRRPLTVRWIVGVGAALGLSAAGAAGLAPLGTAGLGGLLRLDALARVLLLVVAAVGALSTADSLSLWRREFGVDGRATACGRRGVRRVGAYFLWHQAFLGSLLLAALSANLGLSWVAIELTTVTSAVLVGFDGGARAVEAAWKYVILCSVGLALALLTVIVFYALSGGGGIQTLGWAALQGAATGFPMGPAKLAYLFALVGFGTKAGLAPLHAWLPDAHSEAPAPVSALLSGVLLAVVLCTLVRVAAVTAAVTGPDFPYHLLLGAGMLSVGVAAPFMLLQDDLKRLLAYSSIEQVGLMAVGFGLHSPLTVTAAVLQLVVHALTKAGLFFAAGHVRHEAGSQRLARLRGVGRSAPLLGMALLFGVLTLGGLPPFGMFFSELAIVQGALAASVGIGILLLVLMAVIFGGLSYFAGKLMFGAARGTTASRATASAVTVLGFPAVLSVLVGFWTPGVLARGISAAASLVLGVPAL
jgi:hydrogenase-4 component F